MAYLLKQILRISIILISLNTTANSEVINRIVAHVGNKVITEYDIQNLDPAKYNEILAIKDENIRNKQIELYQEAALNYLIDQEIVIIAAEKEGVKVSDEEVEMAINDIMRENKLTLKTLEDALIKEGTSLSKYKYKLKNDIINARVRNQILLPKIIATEKDIRRMADLKSDEYNLKDKYKLSIIITTDKNTMNKAIKEIKKTSFEEAAKKYSIDKSATNNGYMGELEVDGLSQEMLKNIKKTKIGKISKPFKSNNQWIIFRVDGFISKYNFDEETRKKLIDDVSNELFQIVFNNWLEQNKSKIVVIRENN